MRKKTGQKIRAAGVAVFHAVLFIKIYQILNFTFG